MRAALPAANLALLPSNICTANSGQNPSGDIVPRRTNVPAKPAVFGRIAPEDCAGRMKLP
jgi:hypothetical protein